MGGPNQLCENDSDHIGLGNAEWVRTKDSALSQYGQEKERETAWHHRLGLRRKDHLCILFSSYGSFKRASFLWWQGKKLKLFHQCRQQFFRTRANVSFVKNPHHFAAILSDGQTHLQAKCIFCTYVIICMVKVQHRNSFRLICTFKKPITFFNVVLKQLIPRDSPPPFLSSWNLLFISQVRHFSKLRGRRLRG